MNAIDNLRQGKLADSLSNNTIIGTKNPLDQIIIIENLKNENKNNYSTRTLYCKPSDIQSNMNRLKIFFLRICEFVDFFFKFIVTLVYVISIDFEDTFVVGSRSTMSSI